MLLFVVVLALLSPAPAQAETLQIRLNAAPELSALLPAAAILQARVISVFEERYGQFVDAAPDGSPGTDPGARAFVSVASSGSVISITAEIVRGASRRSLLSTVPRAALGSLVPTITGDLAYLWLSLRSFADLSLSSPPTLVASISIDALGTLTGWQPEELEPICVTGAKDGVIVCFPHRWLTLGPSFQPTPATVRDILIQGAAPEPLQISGLVSGQRGEIYLLSERDGKIATVHPLTGARQLVDAPMVTGLGGSALHHGGLGILSNGKDGAGIALYRNSSTQRIRTAAAYASAMGTDAEGNFWVWDAGERRVRVICPEGSEVSSIKPLFDGAVMQLPQQLLVLGDGAFLLGGSGEVWKFDARGVPIWRLRQTGGRPPEGLPASFTIAAFGPDQLVLLDVQSRRLLQFGAKEVDLQEQKSRLFGGLGDSFVQDLLYNQAEKAYQNGVDSARARLIRAPDDLDADRELVSLRQRAQEVHDALVRASDFELTVAGAPRLQSVHGFHDTLRVSLRLRNSSAAPMADVRVDFILPGIMNAPGTAEIALLAAGETRQVDLTLGLEDPWALDMSGPTLPGRALFEWGPEDARTRASLSAPVLSPGPETPPSRELADSLAFSAAAADPLLLELAGHALAEAGGDSLTALASLLDWTGELRSRAGGAKGDEPPASRQDFRLTDARSILRALSTDARDWTLLTASLGVSLGLPAGIMAWNDVTLALIETDIPFSEALNEMPFLAPFSATLRRLSRDGRLCLPLSGRMFAQSPANAAEAGVSGSAARACAEGLRECQRRGTGSAVISWIESGPAPGFASGLPFDFPSVPSAPSRDTVRLEIQQALGEGRK